MRDITQLLHEIDEGDPQAASELLPLVYEELKKLAAARMAAERDDHTLQATALVHEAYLRLIGAPNGENWHSQGHFFGAAAEAMRRILVEHARRKQSQQRGGAHQRVSLTLFEPFQEHSADEILALNEAVDQLAQLDPHLIELVKLRVFAGLTNDEAAAALDLPPSTAKKHWLYARACLRRTLADESGFSGSR